MLHAFASPSEPAGLKPETVLRRFLVADDHPLYIEAIRFRLQRLFPRVEIVEYTNFDDLVPADGGTAEPIDLILCDLRMPGLAGPQMIGTLVRRFPGVPVAIMSGTASDTDVQTAIAAGARAFLPKTMPPACFAAAINILMSGGTYLPAEILEHMVPRAIAPPAVPAADQAAVDRAREVVASLTPREREVLSRLTAGMPNKAIGNDLHLSEVTVKLHVRQILKKAGVRNRSAAAATATRAGLV